MMKFNMKGGNDGSNGWLSKANPPKAFLKTPVANSQKGPLSRITPPRKMLINHLRKSTAVSYLTQNSPPTTQLMTARKQSTLNDYFGAKEDKCKPGVKEKTSVKKEQASVITIEQEFPFDQSLQMVAKESSGAFLYEKRNMRHILYQNSIKDQCLVSENYKEMKENDVTCCKSDPVPQMYDIEARNKFDSVLPSSENCCSGIYCSCNKENILSDCKMKCSLCLKQDARAKAVTCYEEHNNSEILPKEIGSRLINDTGEFTFSEGLKFLSQEDTFKCDNVGSYSIRHNHNLAKECDNSLLTKCEDFDNMSFERHIQNGRKCDRFIRDEKNLNKVIKESDIRYRDLTVSNLHQDTDECDSLVSIKGDVQSRGEYIPSSNRPEKHTSLMLEHRDRDALRMLQDSGGDRDALRMLQDSGGDRDALRMLQDSGGDGDALRMLQGFNGYHDSIDRDAERMLFDSGGDQGSLCCTISSLSHDNLTEPLKDCANIVSLQLQHKALQYINTPDFLAGPFTEDQRNGTDTGSMSSQWSALRSDEFQRKKQQYMSDIGTIGFSENV